MTNTMPPPFLCVIEDDCQQLTHPETDHSDLKGKIMLAAVASLGVVIFLLTSVHIARCILTRRSRSRSREAMIRTRDLNLAALELPPLRGLDPFVIASLPIFAYKQTDNGTANSECAVCLSLLEDQEMARVLPNCRHTFHAECIDKWLGSRSTCPICRTEAEPMLPRPLPRDGPIASPDHHHSMTISPLDPTVASECCSKAVGGSSSRLSSFRRMLSLNRSSTGRIQAEVHDDVSDDLEAQTSAN